LREASDIEQKENNFVRGIIMTDDDGLPLDEVGSWAKEKHERLRKYVDISRAARRKFTQGSGGATYIDLYCGSGRSIIRETDEKIDGSPLVAFKCGQDGGVPFSQLHIADAAEEKCRAAQSRIVRAGGAAEVEVGNADVTATRIVRRLNPYGLHFAFLDPFNLDDLPFSVFQAFGTLRRIDMLIHVSAQDLQRNLDRYSHSENGPLDRFAPGWRAVVDLKQSQASTRAGFIAYWASKMESLGLPPARYELVSGAARNQRLYWLVFVSRSDFAKSLWDKIRNLSGQGELL
jgi:three-Cys-motif partner protein